MIGPPTPVTGRLRIVAPRRTRAAAALAAAALLGGCTTFSPDGGFASVEQTTRERVDKEVRWGRTEADRAQIASRVDELLSRPLTADAAVQVALLNNRGLQASFYDLALSEANLVQAGRLANPHFSMFRASGVEHAGREYKIEQALVLNILALVTMPAAIEIEQRRFAQTQRQVALDVLRLAADTRKAWLEAVAAEESSRYMQQVKQLASAGAELARRMAQVGNWSRLAQAREQGFYAEAALGIARAEHSAVAARERLTRLLGLWGTQVRLSLPERLPDLPAQAQDQPDVERRAMEQRLDLRAARLEAEALAKNLGLAQATRFINVLELGPARVLEGERDAPYKRGYEISFELPLFDWGTAKVAKAEAIYMAALNRAAQMAIEARSEVREAYAAYRIRHDLARHFRDEIVPLRKRIAEENLLRYNGMLIGVFDLLADAREQIATVNRSIEALRDFWLAHVDLDMALAGRPSPSAAAGAMATAEAAGGKH